MRRLYAYGNEVNNIDFAIIVEGKNDKKRLNRLLHEEVPIYCTYGTPNTDKIETLKQKIGDRQVYLFMDNDASGKKIRAALRDVYPDAEHIYTRKGYAGVEGTPEEYIIQQLEKAGLEEYIRYPEQSTIPVKPSRD